MQANKVLYRKYFPNSQISDASLTILLSSLNKYYPGKDIKVIFKEMQVDNDFWSNFKAKYPHANVSKFHLDNTDGVRNIYYVIIGPGVNHHMIRVFFQKGKLVH